MTKITPNGELVLREISLESETIKSIKPRWKRTQYRAVVNWLTEYKPHANASNLEKVKGYLEAFYHLCQAEDWDRASQLIFIRLNTPTKQEFHKQLYTWGYYQIQIEIYTQILNFIELNLQTKATILTNLGKANIALVNFDQAIKYLKQSLRIAQKIESPEEEEEVRGNLGRAYLSKGNFAAGKDLMGNFDAAIKFDRAWNYFQQSLKISRKIKDSYREGRALGGIGTFYAVSQKYDQAIDYYQKQLAIGKQIQNLSLEARAKCNLGIVYCELKNYEQAIEFSQSSLAIARELQDSQLETGNIENLGLIERRLGNHAKAIELSQNLLVTAKETNNISIENLALGDLAKIYYSQGDGEKAIGNYDKAIENYKQSLSLVNKLQSSQEETVLFLRYLILLNLGEIYTAKKDYVKVVDYCKNIFFIAEKNKSIEGLILAIICLTKVYQQKKDSRLLIKSYQGLALIMIRAVFLKLVLKLIDLIIVGFLYLAVFALAILSPAISIVFMIFKFWRNLI
ncbi:MAG: tetratricopeptide repeat protein [Okeania sp. SIO3I5]|uniref:tetratricopeptide repeat protein n=1 Tax=Okeania sp. SIO3I5 TaxID=2607805 RepID=UPI0013B62459|nr:tetratricopeptide repeat protein [Okeania sp. SIO3I5]NEQ39306.1 tetratricopeptide repeat protein [Okeania sp. SIO3I5]